MKKYVCFFVPLLLSACAQYAQLKDGYGNIGYELACFANSTSGCNKMAKELCPNGYSVLEDPPDRGPVGITWNRTILCHATPSAPPSVAEPAPAPPAEKEKTDPKKAPLPMPPVRRW